MLQLTRAAPDKLRLTLYVAPRRARDLQARLKSRDIKGWLHSKTTIRIEEPLSIWFLYARTGGLIGAHEDLRRYVELRALLRPGQRRPQDVTESLQRVVDDILAVQGD